MNKKKNNFPTLPFSSSEEWRAWLEKNYTTPGLWLQLYKKASGIPTITYQEALDIALCYGWIDGQKNSFDADSWLQKFTPRRTKSVWSKINRGNIERLTEL